ncbi:putative Platelet glycoprotein V [Hypsibius exemplaris]|uniref:Platelet glycoprotein V n=1 Tax=Hypsibius exemplaris TaxID=2072580 RepID=A0A1W0WE11_HYPEX|nr:putative Platelet glycoprotein V [Hypsibius exemplaris]
MGGFAWGSCPKRCLCDIDEFGRKRVSCLNGGMVVPDDISMLDADTKVIIITGFDGSRPNLVNPSIRHPNQWPSSRYLEEFHFCYSELDTLGDRPFFQLSESLLLLNLSHNAITTISEGNFFNLTKVEGLYMDYNQLTSMPSMATLRYMTSLKALTLSFNHIRDISHSDIDTRYIYRLRPRAEVEFLDISSNPLGVVDHFPALPDYFFYEFPALRAMNASNCSLTELPWADIQKYSPLLTTLDLSYNRFTSIKTGQLDLTRIRTITFRGNPIQTVDPDSFNKMYFQKLDLSELPKTILTPELFVDVRVERLVLADMKIDFPLDDILIPLWPDIVGLDVSGNPDLPLRGRAFEFLPYLSEVSLARMNWNTTKQNLFRYPNEIDYIDLSYNRFYYVQPGFFMPLTGLVTLDLSNNWFYSIPLTVAQPTLETLDINNNKLQVFSAQLVELLSAPGSPFKALYLNGNPWRCDCGIAELYQWVQTIKNDNDVTLLDNCSQLYDPDHRLPNHNINCAACMTPRALRGLLLHHVPAQTFETCTEMETTTSFGFVEQEIFQCYSCIDPWFCNDVNYMTVVNCDNRYGTVYSCLKIEDIYGIERGCGNPDEWVKQENCEEELGPYKNYTTCTCTTTLCNGSPHFQVALSSSVFMPVLLLCWLSLYCKF